MSLEDALNRLASAAERNYSGSAVAEIIRQRDAAIKNQDYWKQQYDWEQNRRKSIAMDLEVCQRRNSALRGVITRMKKAKENGK